VQPALCLLKAELKGEDTKRKPEDVLQMFSCRHWWKSICSPFSFTKSRDQIWKL